MNKELFIGIIPVGDVDIVGFVKNNVRNIEFTQNVYYQQRYIDVLNSFYKNNNITDLPVFIPNASAIIHGDINFRMIIANRLYPKDVAVNKIVVDNNPWNDNPMNYYESSRFVCQRIVKDYDSKILIVVGNYPSDEICLVVEEVVNLCREYGRSFKIVHEQAEGLIDELVVAINRNEVIDF